MNATVDPAISGAIGTVAGLILGYGFDFLKEQWKTRLAFRQQFAKQKFEAYAELWSMLAPISRSEPRNELVIRKDGKKYRLNSENMKRFYERFQRFFYSKHGIFVSHYLRGLVFDSRRAAYALIPETESVLGEFELTRADGQGLRRLYEDIRITVRSEVGLRDAPRPTEQQGR